jgi:hypothetical protein
VIFFRLSNANAALATPVYFKRWFKSDSFLRRFVNFHLQSERLISIVNNGVSAVFADVRQCRFFGILAVAFKPTFFLYR